MKKDILSDICVALLILLFSYTAASKLIDHHRFVFQMTMSPSALVKMTAPYISWLLPAAEAVVAIALLIRSYRLKALFASLILLISFEVYIVSMLLSGLDLPCTCGGVISKMSWNQHVLFNGLFIVITLLPIVHHSRHKAFFADPSKQDNTKDISRA